jgi:hypothetical protein
MAGAYATISTDPAHMLETSEVSSWLLYPLSSSRHSDPWVPNTDLEYKHYDTTTTL